MECCGEEEGKAILKPLEIEGRECRGSEVILKKDLLQVCGCLCCACDKPFSQVAFLYCRLQARVLCGFLFVLL